MYVRELKEEDYQNTLFVWWKDWGWDPPSQAALPDNGLGGLIVFSEDTPVCAGFLYETNSAMCWIEFIVSDKNYDGDDRSDAILMLIKGLSSIATDKGFKFIFTSFQGNPGLESKYKQCGFIESDKNCTQMIKVLWQQ